MKSLIRLTENDFLEAVIDTRYDLEVTDINNEEAVVSKLEKLYGKRTYAIKNGRVKVAGSTELYKEKYSVGDLARIMGLLTADNGCPWDKVQTHESIRINAVEEAYELAEAINNGDLDNMEEEIGDLLLQSVFHANISRRNGEFDITDVITLLCRKLVNRHTHIFGSDVAANPEEALKSWEAAKAIEKKEETIEDKLKRIPESFPSTLKIQKTIKKLVKDGLVNDAPKATAAELLKAVAGAVGAGLDVEVELLKEADLLAKDYLDGKIKKISEYR